MRFKDTDGDTMDVQKHDKGGASILLQSKDNEHHVCVVLSNEQVAELVEYISPLKDDERWAKRIQTLEARLEAVRKAADGK